MKILKFKNFLNEMMLPELQREKEAESQKRQEIKKKKTQSNRAIKIPGWNKY